MTCRKELASGLFNLQKELNEVGWSDEFIKLAEGEGFEIQSFEI